MIFARANRPKEASFDLTPMIDVVLLLIIFFMLTSQFAQSHMRPMDLPREGGQGQPDWSPASVVLDMDRAGTITVLGRAVGDEELRAMVTAPGTSVVVRADQAGPASNLNRLAERLVAWNVRDWKLATNPEGAPRGGTP